jgi:hypothetical protein
MCCKEGTGIGWKGKGAPLLGLALLPVAPSACALLVSGCQYDVYSPPARALPLETAATLPRGDTGIQLEGALHANGLFGFQATSGALRVREGIGGRTDVSEEVTVIHIDGQSAADTYPNIFGVRGGLKHELVKGVALIGGAGGGASAGGGFVSPDIGAVASYENPYFVPFAEFRTTVSIPFDRRSVDTSTPQDGIGKYVYLPPFTFMVGGMAGARIPLGWRVAPGRVRGSLLGGIGYTHLTYFAGNDADVISLAVGTELVF